MSTNDRTEEAITPVQVKTQSPEPNPNLEKNQRLESEEPNTKDMLKKVFTEAREKQSAEDQAQSQINQANEPLTRDELKQKRLAEKEAKRQGKIQKRIQAKNPQAAETDNDAETESTSKKKNVRVRLIPIWLRLVIIFLLMVLSLTVGTMVGYGVIGDGKPLDALKQSTWTHIIDIINKEE
jgi:cation transport ATPase